MPEPSTPWHRFRKFITDYGDIQTVMGLAAGFITAARKLSLMPGGWHPPQYWFSAFAWFFGGWSVFLVVVKSGEWIWRRLQAPSATLDVYGGENVSVVLTNTGSVPIKYLATAQLLDASEVSFKRIRPFNLTILHGYIYKTHETTAGIVCETHSRYSSPDELWLRGDTTDVVDRWPVGGRNSVERSWIRMRFTIRTDPPMPSGAIQRCYEFRFNGETFDLKEFKPRQR